MHHLLRRRCLSALAPLRNGLRMPLWGVMVLCLLLGPAGTGQAHVAPATRAPSAAVGAGEETPAGETAAQETPAKLRRVTTLQAPRAACLRAAPPRPVACAVDSASTLTSALPAASSAPPAALPRHWRSQRSQAPPSR